MKTIEKKAKYETFVETKFWGPDDYYNVVTLMDQQVMEEEGFKKGDRVEVEVIIRKLGKVEKFAEGGFKK